MSSARAKVLNSVGMGGDVATIRTEARMLIDAPEKVRPSLPFPDVVDSFIARVSGPKVGASVERISSIHGLPGVVAHWLVQNGLGAIVAIQPVALMQSVDWASAGITLSDSVNEGVAVGLARWGIAETGSLVVHSAPDTPILLNFLPAIHLVAVFADRIVAYLEDYAAVARDAGDPAPRNACLITGASGTTDIEGDLVKGAHGPRQLHIIVINSTI